SHRSVTPLGVLTSTSFKNGVGVGVATGAGPEKGGGSAAKATRLWPANQNAKITAVETNNMPKVALFTRFNLLIISFVPLVLQLVNTRPGPPLHASAQPLN